MKIIIKGEEKQLKFTIKALNWLDEIYKFETSDGLSFGIGVQMLYQNIEMRSIPGLYNALRAGFMGQTISSKDVEEYIEQLGEFEYELDENGEEIVPENITGEIKTIEELFEEVSQKLKKSSLTKGTIKQLLKNQREMEQKNQI